MKRLPNFLELVIWIVGLSLTGYIGFSVFGWVKHGPAFYVNFVLGIVAMSGLLALSELDIRAREERNGKKKAAIAAKRLLVAGAMISGLIGLGYFRINIESLTIEAPFFDQIAVVMGFFTIASMVILTWFHWGWLLAGISVIAVGYIFLGHLVTIPLLQHPQYTPEFAMNYVALNTGQGFFLFAGPTADEIYLLIFFGVTLLGVGILRLAMQIGQAAGSKFKGGAAFPAIISSGLVGSVIGQALSNVALTGRFTIPMMKKHHYDGGMAGAIEATASSVGQFMPPVLGLAGFLIASFLGIPYITVALAALIPAVLYVTGISASIVVYALRKDLPKLYKKVDRALIWRMLPTLLIPFVAVIWLLLDFRSPGYAALVGIALALVLSLFQGRYRPTLSELKSALREGLVLTTTLSLLILAVGPLGQAMITTNLSGRLATLLATILPDIEILLLIGAMVLAIVLGMGLPTPIAYLVASMALVPFLQEIGVEALRAHFFVFYFAVFSTLTPPVAVSVLAAAKIANASFLETSIHALKIASTTFIIPYAFIFNAPLLAFPNVDTSVIIPILEVVGTQVACAITAYGYCFKVLHKAERAWFGVVVTIGYWTLSTHGRPLWLDIALLSGLLVGFAWCFVTRHRTQNQGTSAERVVS